MATEVNLSEIVEAAQPRANLVLPYHNLERGLATLSHIKSYSRRLGEAGLVIPIDEIRAAAVLQYVGYGEDHLEAGYQTKQELAADRSDTILKKLDARKEFRSAVGDLIVTTAEGTVRDTPQAIVLNRGNRANLAVDRTHFRKDAFDRWREDGLLMGEQRKPWAAWLEERRAAIGDVIEEAKYELPTLAGMAGVERLGGHLSLRGWASFGSQVREYNAGFKNEPEPRIGAS